MYIGEPWCSCPNLAPPPRVDDSPFPQETVESETVCMLTELSVLNGKVTETSWHQLRCQSWSFGHTQTSSTKMGSVPRETEGAGEPASTLLNVVLIWKAQGDIFFINSQPFSSTRSATTQCSLGARGQFRDWQAASLPVTQLQLGSSLTLPLLWLKWEGYGNYHPWDSGENQIPNTARQEGERKSFSTGSAWHTVCTQKIGQYLPVPAE